MDLHEEKAFQQEEQTLAKLLIDEKFITAPLNRANLPSNEVETDFVSNLDKSKGDDQFINDDEIENDIYISITVIQTRIYTSRKIQILMSRSIFFVQFYLPIMVYDIIVFIRILFDFYYYYSILYLFIYQKL